MPEIPAPKLPPLRPAELMQMEKETVGLYLSGHPLDEYRTRLRAAGVTPVLRILQTASSTTARTSASRAWSRRSAARRPATDP